MKKASASISGSLGGLIGLIVGVIIPFSGESFINRITGGAVMQGPQVVVSVLYIIIAVLICGAIGAILGSLAE